MFLDFFVCLSIHVFSNVAKMRCTQHLVWLDLYRLARFFCYGVPEGPVEFHNILTVANLLEDCSSKLIKLRFLSESKATCTLITLHMNSSLVVTQANSQDHLDSRQS